MLDMETGVVCDISIHAPRTGSDQFELPLVIFVDLISIHAPRTGSDRRRLDD